MGCVSLMVVVVGMGSLWWRWLWFLVEFGVHRSDLGGLDQILTLFSKKVFFCPVELNKSSSLRV